MRKASLATVAKKMQDLDYCMMVTQDGRGTYHSRPMSNNGEVAYDGTSWFFSYEDSNKVRQLSILPQVALVFQAKPMLFLTCYGKATLVRRGAELREHWVPGLQRWFPKGVDTPGILLIKVITARVHFWDESGEGEYRVG